MDRVATTAGVAKGSLYNYFESKDDLLRFFNTRLVEPFFQAMEEIVNAELPAAEKLERILATALEHVVKDKSIMRLLAVSGQEPQIKRRATGRDSCGCSRRFLSRAFERGRFRRTTPRIRAACFSGVCRSCSSCRRKEHRARK